MTSCIECKNLTVSKLPYSKYNRYYCRWQNSFIYEEEVTKDFECPGFFKKGMKLKEV